MGMASREELEAMDREELKALLDEQGVEYSPHAHTPTLVDLALGEGETDPVDKGGQPHGGGHGNGGDEGDGDGEVGGTTVTPEDFYAPQAFSPWELPANTGAAQLYIDRGIVVDESLVPDEDRLAAANNEIELHGHPDDPRLTGGSLTGFDATALPSREVEIEIPEVEEESRTWGQKLEADNSEGAVEEAVEKVEEKV